LGHDARDDATSRLIPWRPTVNDVCEANRAVLDTYQHPEHYKLRDRGFLERALTDACGDHDESGDDLAAISAAAKLAHLIARAQAFRDGNHRTALVVAQTYLANNDLGALSTLGSDDIEMTEHIAGTGIKSTSAQYGPEDTIELLRVRLRRAYTEIDHM
jgi:prophage maintenance system killer protein